jgi:hypothetical protein
MNEPAIVRLRNGAEVPEPLVRTTQLAIELLMGTDPIALYELVQVARDPAHVMFGLSGPHCADLSLTEQQAGRWVARNAVRDIVLSATEGEGFDLSLCNPLEQP